MHQESNAAPTAATTAATTAVSAGTVPHPLHAYLTALVKRVHRVQTTLGTKQQRPSAAIFAGTAWVSTAATLWAQQYKPRSATYTTAVRALNDDVEDLLRRTPATCTPEEAARWRARLGGHHGA